MYKSMKIESICMTWAHPNHTDTVVDFIAIQTYD